MLKKAYEPYLSFCNPTPLKSVFIAAIVFVAIVLGTQVCKAGSDLDDDISKYKDDPISKWDELGKDTPNISFIIAEALGRINLTDKGSVNINSVVVGPGSNVGDIYNIHLDDMGGVAIPNNESNTPNNEGEEK